ncbi:luc7-like protein 3 [Pollicipes pollicipes]|uniref:luc7-like protein 3 n=1 Tax=Pollicipes pollicipes TaxID=41117 RepID=UPI00188518AF|nr:luc7-like protein 3 [Pollicipes pollicipes]
MTDYAANLLNELMGRNRDLLPDQQSKKLTYDSPEVCRYYLVKLCPHDLFTNTKVDLGPCGGIHDDAVREEFLQLPAYRRVVFEDEFLRYCQTMLNEVERKIRKSKQRLELQPDDEKLASLVPPQFTRHEEKIGMLTGKITKLVTEAEELGCKGQVEEAQGIMKLCDKLKDERDRLRRNNEGSVWHQAAEMAASQEKQMQVCEICGAFLILGDAQQRIDDHLTGKQHMGYARLKVVVDEIRENREQEKRDQETAREREREQRRQRDETDRSGPAGSRERTSERGRAERDRGGRNGERDRSDRRRQRSRSRDRDRERDRERRRSRDRERQRDPDRDRQRESDRERQRDPDRDRQRESDRERQREPDRDRQRESDRDRHSRRSGRRSRSSSRSSRRSRDRRDSRDRAPADRRHAGHAEAALEFLPSSDKRGQMSLARRSPG